MRQRTRVIEPNRYRTPIRRASAPPSPERTRVIGPYLESDPIVAYGYYDGVVLQVSKLLRAGGGVTQLTSGSTYESYSPVAKPDYSKIAFYRQVAATGNDGRIWCMNADGSGATQLTSGTGTDHAGKPTWHPTSDLIVFSQRTAGIQRITSAGTGLTTIKAVAGTDKLMKPKYSYDGSKIAYLRAIGPGLTTYDICVVDADGTNPVTLETAANLGSVLNGSDFAWANLSNVLAYGNSRSGVNARHYTINADGTGKTTIRTGVAGDANGQVMRFGWYPDDTAIAAVTAFNASGYRVVKITTGGVTSNLGTFYTNDGSGPFFYGSRMYFVKHVVGAPSVQTFISMLGDATGERTEATGGADNQLERFGEF